MRRLARLLLAAGLLLLGGCSTLQLGYNNADALLTWRADSYFDLDPPQRHDFRERLDRLLAWHRREQLPDYARFVKAAVERARGGLRREDLLWFVDGFKLRYRAIVERGAVDAAEVLATLTPEQIRHLAAEFARTNRRFAAEHELDDSLDTQKRARNQRVLQQITDWTGSLSRTQEQRIEGLLEAVPLFEHLRQQDRMRRQREFLDLLRLRTSRAEFAARLRAWLLDWEAGRAPEFERLMTEVTERRIEFYLAVERLLTPAQRERALKRLAGFGDDFRALAARDAPAPAADKMPAR